MNAELRRLQENNASQAHWNRWGPYLSERQWGTVREDYSPGGAAWDYFPHDHARSRAYRWGEDGLGGICDRHGILCFAMALWNKRDPILKERLFGLTGREGNHGEDVKECYFYLDNTPTHSYMRFLYKYPQREFPYSRLVEENRRRGKREAEFELVDTGVFDENRYFDVFVEYAKASPDDLCIRFTLANRGPETAELDLLPTLWFRNTWSWTPDVERPRLSKGGNSALLAECSRYGQRWLFCEGDPQFLFTENDTNTARLFQSGNKTRYSKDAFHRYLIDGERAAIHPDREGTKAAALYSLSIPAGGEKVVRLRWMDGSGKPGFGREFDEIIAQRRREADVFYESLAPGLDEDRQRVQRQAFAGLLWNKQFYHYDIHTWLEGDPSQPPPPSGRLRGRNSDWKHVYTNEVLLMPDKWEYPWFAAWDLAFQCVACAAIDPHFAKSQLHLLTREWYMNPNGQFPAYEWAFGDVNPPVQAWAALRIYRMEKEQTGAGDRVFLERIFHKCLLNFTWWVNRKDATGNNIFQGGFLGMDNVGIFDRSAADLPTGGYIEQVDGTAWMGMYSLNLMAIALELARENRAYGATASKFFEHFLNIAHAINHFGCDKLDLWNEEDGFYYDILRLPHGVGIPLKVRSMVGLTALLAVETLEPEVLAQHPHFDRRSRWFLDHRPEYGPNVISLEARGVQGRRLLSIVDPNNLRRMLSHVLDETSFLSPYGLRSISRYHEQHPFVLRWENQEYAVGYEPAESQSGVFGGNSNWRGPIWFPLNFLLIEALRKYHDFYGDEFQVECPTASGQKLTLGEAARELSRRLSRIFLRDAKGRRPVFGSQKIFQDDAHWKDYIPFHEYFHGDTGAGLGASHHTGWTALAALLIQESRKDHLKK